ncbi:hypothetical protein CY34DRAFT_717441 [Suillus luteus UH-Slu-Lm8-n1]|uniref:Uncharacterized protein n=1 Tax=Suillus luteus UH-Slu-Lm8-n1 TaxID=930992 RepID=A0A0D0BJB5_9AGAM|nr:hypothetical protein CY34DRAFT_717441 [Suillus luteus UH-Slu-Lm8-n1]
MSTHHMLTNHSALPRSTTFCQSHNTTTGRSPGPDSSCNSPKTSHPKNLRKGSDVGEQNDTGASKQSSQGIYFSHIQISYYDYRIHRRRGERYPQHQTSHPDQCITHHATTYPRQSPSKTPCIIRDT